MQPMKILVFFGLLITAYGQPVDSNCPQYWKYYGGSCYALIHNPSPWAAADEICRDFNAYLVEIQNEDENNFLKDWIYSENPRQKRYWIGGADLLSEDNWVWTHSGQAVQYTDWSPGNPSNSAHKENCMELNHYNSTLYLWNDNQCSVALYFFCEKEEPLNPILG